MSDSVEVSSRPVLSMGYELQQFVFAAQVAQA
jgi:hypothetical protein